jgi:glutamate-1-semialdehyde 2,1-aminomutase
VTATVTLDEARRDAEQRFTQANPNSLRRFVEASRWMPGGNTRTALHYSPFPVAFHAAEAQHLTDLDGHSYVDFLGEYSAGLYGHSHPVILQAVRTALEGGVAIGGPNEYEAELASLLCSRFPSVELIRFTNSGTEANLMALATATVMTGRSRVMVFEGGYHGGVLSYRGEHPTNVPYPVIRAEFNDAEGARSLIERHHGDLAAVIVEPMLGGAGAIPGSREFLVALREATGRNGVVLIFDEVMTSRLSPGGLQQVHGIRPDLTTFGKYVGGGFTFGAFGGARRLMERYDPSHPATLSHAGTFNNNVITMAAGTAGLRDVYTPEVALAHNARGDGLRDRLNAAFDAEGVAMQATGIGSLLNLHFQRAPIASVADLVPGVEAKRALVHLAMLERGYYFARRGYIALSLALQPEDLDGLVAALTEVVLQHRSLLQEGT